MPDISWRGSGPQESNTTVGFFSKCVSYYIYYCLHTDSSSPRLFVGLQLLAWEPGRDGEVSMVTARPNFQDSVHVGYVAGLKKFTEYYTSVLCFTTPGDGPRSPPRALRTHEDSE